MQLDIVCPWDLCTLRRRRKGEEEEEEEKWVKK